MIDVARIAALLVAAHGCGRARYGAGVAAAGLIAALYALTMTVPVVLRTLPGYEGHAFLLAFWGPSRLPMPTGVSAILDVLGRFPMVGPLATAAIAWLASRYAFLRAKPMRPESERARGWDRAGMRFLFVAILDGILFVISVMAAFLLERA